MTTSISPLVQAPPAREDDVLLVHTRPYLETVRREIAAGATMLSTGDTALSPGSWEAALAAAGTVIAAVDAVMRGDAANAFCAVRPVAIQEMQKRGLKVVDVDEATRNAWQTESERAYPQLRGRYCPGDVFDMVLKLRDEYRKGAASAPSPAVKS
jgi:hypothetical protein